MKKIIIIFIGGYLPGCKYGGPVTSIENFTNQFHEWFDIRIICSDHDFKEAKRYPDIHEGWNRVGHAQVYYTNEKYYNIKYFHDIIKEFTDNIALFYLSGIYYIKMNYAAIILGRKLNIPVLLAPRGDLMKNTITMKSKRKMIKKLVFLAICRYSNLFHDIYFQSTSDEETSGLHHYLGIKDQMIFQLPNMPVMKHERVGYRKMKNQLRVVFISRIMVKKNPKLALEAIKNISDEYNVTFDLFGPKEDPEYWMECSALIDNINKTRSNIQVSYRGSLDPMTAKTIYSSYDCFLFPTASENYGHVIVESLFSGCPVIISRGTTPFDDCHERAGFVAELDNPREFTLYMEKIARMDETQYNSICEKLSIYIEEKFQTDKLRQEYLNMLTKITGE